MLFAELTPARIDLIGTLRRADETVHVPFEESDIHLPLAAAA